MEEIGRTLAGLVRPLASQRSTNACVLSTLVLPSILLYVKPRVRPGLVSYTSSVLWKNIAPSPAWSLVVAILRFTREGAVSSPNVMCYNVVTPFFIFLFFYKDERKNPLTGPQPTIAVLQQYNTIISWEVSIPRLIMVQVRLQTSILIKHKCLPTVELSCVNSAPALHLCWGTVCTPRWVVDLNLSACVLFFIQRPKWKFT